ncbi:MAG: ATP-dependent DNA ligase [Candidatus Obscuribacterales bacterium]|nr:ATP-dependent DNA ligase [Steroidobacteraceae bacterium]
MTQLSLIVETWQRVAETPRRTIKIRELSECLRQLEADEVEIGVLYLAGEIRQKKIGIGPSALRAASAAPAADSSQLALTQVDEALTLLAGVGGSGSAAERSRQLQGLFARATTDEQEFLIRLLGGDLRQGALAGVMVDGIAAAAELPLAEVRRAAMYAPHLGLVARVALGAGSEGLRQFTLQTLSPLAPMLAETASDVADALTQLGGTAILEWKVDGARIQVHKRDDEMRVYTRNLNDVSSVVPEVVEVVRSMPARELVLDGETVALNKNGNPLPFQITMRRFGRKLDVDALRRDLPLHAYFFDCIKINDDDLSALTTRERFDALSSVVPQELRIPRITCSDVADAEAFYAQALAKGHEGVMAKALDAPYEAGKRGASWLKIKRAHTLDLVVLAVEWGNGRRTGKLSNLHLGARDPSNGDFVMLGKTFKGLTDALLEWQTKELLERELRRDQWTVYVRPELVVEVAFNDIQSSSTYPGRFALRFARVKRYRPDKQADQADTIDTIRKLFNAQSGVEAHANVGAA